MLHTGQHYDRELSDVFFEELGLSEPAYRLDLHSADPDTMRPGIASAVERELPDWVLVYGDTNSTLAGAEAAGAVPVAHVEAGLRSGDLSMPEERNRIAVDRMAALLLCPDERSRATLVQEGVPGRIEVVGDVMADASFRLAPVARERSTILDRLGLDPGGYLVATVHREANVRPQRHGIANLAMATGNLGREGGGVSPLRGQNNVQGSCDMGSFPHEFSAYRHVSDPAVRASFEAVWGVPLQAEPGLRIPNMFEAALDGTFRGMYVQGEDFVQSDPNTHH